MTPMIKSELLNCQRRRTAKYPFIRENAEFHQALSDAAKVNNTTSKDMVRAFIRAFFKDPVINPVVFHQLDCEDHERGAAANYDEAERRNSAVGYVPEFPAHFKRFTDIANENSISVRELLRYVIRSNLA